MLPIVAGILARIAPGIIRAVQSAFGPNTGATKLEVATKALKIILEQMATAGTVPGMPSDGDLVATIETILATMKQRGELSPSAAANQGRQIQLPAGSEISITLKADTTIVL